MKSLSDYILTNGKPRFYRLKTILPITPDVLNTIKFELERYRLVDITKPIRGIIQPNPQEFPGLARNVNVWHVDFSIEVPESSLALAEFITSALKAAPGSIIIRQENDPLESDFKALSLRDEIMKDIKEKGEKSLPGDPNYSEIPVYAKEHLAGPEQAMHLLRSLANDSKKNRNIITKRKDDYSGMDLPDFERMAESDEDIHAVPQWGDATEENNPYLTSTGALSGELMGKVTKRAETKTGKTKVYEIPLNPIHKDIK